MSVIGEALSAITGMEEACATARARVDDLVAETDDLKRCLTSVIAQRDEAWGEIEVLRASIEGEPWGAAVLKQERDEARAEVERLQREHDEMGAELRDMSKKYDEVLEANVGLLDDAPWADVRRAYHRGAEAMREHCIGTACAQDLDPDAQDRMEERLRALPIPEEP